MAEQAVIRVLDSRLSLPVAGVTVRFFDALGAQLLTGGTTDEDGEVDVLLPEATYTVRLYKAGMSFGPPTSISVDGAEDNVWDLSGASVAPPTSPDQRVCVVFGTFRDAFHQPLSGVDIHILPKFDPAMVDGDLVLVHTKGVRSDEDGYVEFPLLRCAKYDVTLQGGEQAIREVSVPDLPNINVGDLIYPVVARVELAPVAVSVGESVEVTPVVYASDGNILQGTAHEDVTWTVEDSAVASIAALDETLRIIGLSSGSTQILATRSDRSIITIPDTGIAGQPVSLTVT